MTYQPDEPRLTYSENFLYFSSDLNLDIGQKRAWNDYNHFFFHLLDRNAEPRLVITVYFFEAIWLTDNIVFFLTGLKNGKCKSIPSPILVLFFRSFELVFLLTQKFEKPKASSY